MNASAHQDQGDGTLATLSYSQSFSIIVNSGHSFGAHKQRFAKSHLSALFFSQKVDDIYCFVKLYELHFKR